METRDEADATASRETFPDQTERRRIDQKAAESLWQTWRTAIEPRERHTCSEWVERHVVLDESEGTPWPGRFRYHRYPFSREIADWFGDPKVNAITLMMGSQLVKTRSVVNGILYWLDHDPSPVIYLSGTKDNSDDVAEKKLLPMFRRRPFIGQFVGVRRGFEYRLKRCSLYIAGGQSVMQAASKTARRIVLDEIDKFKKASGDHGDVFDLAQKRVKAYRGSEKVCAVSTPTTKLSRIGKRFRSGSQHQLWVKCPHCRAAQLLKFADNIHDPKTFHVRWDAAVRNPELAGKTAYYECPHCHGRIENKHKADMLADAEFIPRFPERKQHRSAHVSSLCALQLDWGYFAQQYLSCHPLDPDGNVVDQASPFPDSLRTFVNEDLGEEWEEPGQAQTENTIRAHQGLQTPHEYPTHRDGKPFCPIEQPQAVIMYADVQHDRAYYINAAVGAWETLAILEYGSTGLAELAGVFATDYFTAGGQVLRPSLAALDSSDGTMKGPVYDACRKNRWWAFKNRDHGADVYPGKSDTPGVVLVHVNTTALKDYAAWKLGVSLGSPGAIHLPNQVGGDLIRHWTCERRLETWTPDGLEVEWKQSHPDNHLWDSLIGLLAICRLKRFRQKGGGSVAAPAPTAPPPDRPAESRPGSPVRRGQFIRRPGGGG